MVTMPPRHGKSELCSRYFPAWYLGLWPDRRVIQTGYGTEFASVWGRKSRDLMEEIGFDMFEVEIDPSSRAVKRWDIAHRAGGLLAAGVGAGITGFGADLLIIDDPVKDREQADSPRHRERVWNWWTDTSSTRLQSPPTDPGAEPVVLLVMTRWHEDDLGGRLIRASEEDPESEQWVRLDLPALCESPPDAPSGWVDVLGRAPGQALWPLHFNERRLDRIRRRNRRTFEALYQGHPTTPGGDMFKVSRWQFANGVPWNARLLRRWDLAGSEKETTKADPDYTAGVLMAHDPEGRTFILDARRDRLTGLDLDGFLKTTAEWDRSLVGKPVLTWCEQEPGGSAKRLMSYLAMKVLQGVPFYWRQSTGDPVLRAWPFASQVDSRNVFLVRTGDPGRDAWLSEFIEEARVFPHGGHDDMISAAILGYEDLTGTGGAQGHYRPSTPAR